SCFIVSLLCRPTIAARDHAPVRTGQGEHLRSDGAGRQGPIAPRWDRDRRCGAPQGAVSGGGPIEIHSRWARGFANPLQPTLASEEARRSEATAQADRDPSPRDGIATGGAEHRRERFREGGPIEIHSRWGEGFCKTPPANPCLRGGPPERSDGAGRQGPIAPRWDR